MKYFWICLGVVFALLVVIILIKAMLFKDHNKKNLYKSNEHFDSDGVCYKLGALIKFKTISNIDEKKVDTDQFVSFLNKLKELYPLVFANSEVDVAPDYNILFKIKGLSEDKPTVLMAHYDVVPVTDGWDFDPFSGEIIDGYVCGRGALDTKCTVACIMSSLEKAFRKGYQPKNDLYLIFGSNEEVFGKSQVERVKKFKSFGVRPYLVLDEGGGIIGKAFPGVSEDAALLGVVEKGMLNIKLSIDTNGGHSSTPKRNGAIVRLSKAITKLEKHPLPAQYTLTTSELINIMGKHSTLGYKILFGNMWLFKGLIKKLFMVVSADTRALLSTTFAFTTINGGNVTNVLPNHVEANINIRVASFDSTDKIINHIKKVIDDKNSKEPIKVEIVNDQKMYKECSFTSEAYNTIKNTVLETYENVIVSPFVMLGGTDSRHYCEVCENVIRFTPYRITNNERLGIHGLNEKIEVSKLEKCLEFYDNLIQKI